MILTNSALTVVIKREKVNKMVFYLLLITFGVFIIFWLGDLYLTLKTVKHLGRNIELNPIIKCVLRGRGKLIYILKPIELVMFLYLLWFLAKFDGTRSFYILVIFIFIYSLIVLNNAHVYYLVTKKESLAFKLIFVGAIVALLLFLYLNYMLYSNLRVSYDELAKVNEKYSKLSAQYAIENTAEKKPIEEHPITDLNLTVSTGGSFG